MLIYFSDLLSNYHSKSHLESFSNKAFNIVFHLLKTNVGTFGKVDDKPYDLILTNPPYVTSGSGSIKESLSADRSLIKYSENHPEHKEYYEANGRGTEALAIEWIIKNLKPGGQALVVVPDGLMIQENMLSYIMNKCFVQGIISLPIRTFYATNKKTYILIIKKKYNYETQDIPVFTFLVLARLEKLEMLTGL